MESQAALVWTDCRVKLNSEASVDLNVTVVVNPWYSELNKSFRLNQSVNNACLNDVRSLFNYWFKAFQYFLYSLKKFFFTLVSLAYLVVYAL